MADQFLLFEWHSKKFGYPIWHNHVLESLLCKNMRYMYKAPKNQKKDRWRVVGESYLYWVYKSRALSRYLMYLRFPSQSLLKLSKQERMGPLNKEEHLIKSKKMRNTCSYVYPNCCRSVVWVVGIFVGLYKMFVTLRALMTFKI